MKSEKDVSTEYKVVPLALISSLLEAVFETDFEVAASLLFGAPKVMPTNRNPILTMD